MKNFSIGAHVEIKTRFKSNVLGYDYDEPVFVGIIVANPKWLDNDYVCIRTDNPEFPVSQIHKRFIIGFDFPKERSETRVFKVTSKTKGNTYNVISENGLVSCDCVGFQFRRQCKHSNKVKEFIQNA